MRGLALKSAADRFKAQTRTDLATGCLEWTGSLTRGGYAQFVGDSGRRVYVHRWSWEQENGPIPEGLTIDHLCRNRRCANPAHLEAVTHRVNVLRGTGFAPSNAAKTHCPHGHPYSADNTLINSRGSRECRTCKRARSLAHYYVRKQVAS